MNGTPNPSGITKTLEQALQIAKEGQQGQEEAAGQAVEVETAEGQVRVKATLTGKVEVTIVDPRAVRLGAEVLGEEITKGVNEALDAAREQAGLPGAIDLEALTEKVEEIQQQSVQRLGSFMNSLSDAHAKIIESTGDANGSTR